MEAKCNEIYQVPMDPMNNGGWSKAGADSGMVGILQGKDERTFKSHTVDGNPARTPVEVGSLSRYLQGLGYIPGGCLGFLPLTVFECFSTHKLESKSNSKTKVLLRCQSHLRNWFVTDARTHV